MNAVGRWTIERDSAGFLLSRPRPTPFTTTVIICVPPDAAARWRIALCKVLDRLDHSRGRFIPLTRSLRCMTGCWQKDIRQASLYGSIPREPRRDASRRYGLVPGHPPRIIGIGDALYFLAEIDGWAAYPIAREDLEHMGTSFADTTSEPTDLVD